MDPLGSIVQHFVRLATLAPEAVTRGEAVDAIALVLRSWRSDTVEDREEIRFLKQVCGGTSLETLFSIRMNKCNPEI